MRQCPVCNSRLLHITLLKYSVRLYCKTCRRYITLGPEHPIGPDMRAKLVNMYDKLKGA